MLYTMASIGDPLLNKMNGKKVWKKNHLKNWIEKETE